MEQFDVRKGIIKLRRSEKYKVKPDREYLDGKESEFTVLREIEDDIYKGEFAMQIVDEPFRVASGDVIFYD